jgi:hypothetical protein
MYFARVLVEHARTTPGSKLGKFAINSATRDRHASAVDGCTGMMMSGVLEVIALSRVIARG